MEGWLPGAERGGWGLCRLMFQFWEMKGVEMDGGNGCMLGING